MTPPSFDDIERLYHAALELPKAERASYLLRTCGSNPSLLREVESLLAANDDAGDFIAAPAIIASAQWLADEEAARALSGRIGAYEVERLIGCGGMGEVYLAQDTRLGRKVAVKLLRPDLTGNPDITRRFEQEARSASSLNHPNIITIYEIGEMGDRRFLAMEFVDGRSLASITGRPSPIDVVARIGAQLAQALATAHAAGIVHRDIKPENVLVRDDGYVKLLDFGLARLLPARLSPGNGDGDTASGIILGTPRYMSPEQARGESAGTASDIFSLGVMLYELATGTHPFEAESMLGMLHAITSRDTPSPQQRRPDLLPRFERLLRRMLGKHAPTRPSARDVHAELTAIAAGADQSPPQAYGSSPHERQRHSPRAGRVLVSAAVVVIALAGAAGWTWYSGADARWARDVAIPRIEQYADASDWEAAYALAKEVQIKAPDDAALAELWPRFSWVTTIPSDPAGAKVYRRAYSATDDDWEELGVTPLERIRLPFGLSTLRVELEGHRPLLRTLGGGVLVYTELPPTHSPSAGAVVAPDAFTLDTDGSAPPGMVRLPGWRGTELGESIRFRDSFLARYEVTNREYKTFVAAGGYDREDLWEHPVIRDGRTITRDEAMRLFTDKTGRPGPSTWEAGTYPEGHDEYPVSGVSWYEAAAYARFVGQELPTVYHWRQAFGTGLLSWMLPASNMERDGPAPVGQYQGVSWPGTFDMAGNVREWCFNATGDRRFILGGGWNDPYTEAVALSFTQGRTSAPLDRSETNGFRLAVTREDATVLARMQRPLVEPPVPDVAELKPVSDDVFGAHRSMYAYDPAPLNATTDASETGRDWTRERISFDAARGGQRMVLYLYLPRTGSPPFQTVLYWPGAAALVLPSIDRYPPVNFDFLLKNGRAVVFPVLKGTFERDGGKGFLATDGSAASRDSVIEWVNDLRRSIDYLETRADIDANALSFYGHSWGGYLGPIPLAVEPRMRVAVLYGAGLFPAQRMPAAEPVTFLPRVRTPVLMLNGELDNLSPPEGVAPFLKLLGTADVDKKSTVAPGGHFVPRPVLIRETLDWLDKYLGKVRR